MNVFHKYTRRSLRKNRIRTIVTIIGIVLSMSMFTAVTEAVYSGLCYLIRAEEAVSGRYHLCFTDAEYKRKLALKKVFEVRETAELETVGWAVFDETDALTKPYLIITQGSGGYCDMIGLRVLEGRMPENENEILVPEHCQTADGSRLKVGQQLTLKVGTRRIDQTERLSSRDPYRPGEEELTDTVERSYTVTGICARLGSEIERSDCAGYFCFIGEGPTNTATGESLFFVSLRHPRLINRFVEKYAKKLPHFEHTELLRLNGVFGNGSVRTTAYGLAGVLIFLIAFGSISLIYNSFSISVSERTKEFGILKSVGATKRQIRSAVYYEAFLLAAIGIPIGMIVGCAGIGITFLCLKDTFRGLLSASIPTIDLVLVPNFWALLIAAAVCLVTTLISAVIPARRALRITAMDAIRQTKDVKLARRNVGVSPLTKKLFGFSGMMAAKNFKRSRRRYASVIFSLAMSIILFISASSFTFYLKQTVSGFNAGNVNAELGYETVGADQPDPEELRAGFEAVKGVKTAMYFHTAHLSIQNIDPSAIDSRSGYDGLDCWSLDAVFLDDRTFREYCKTNRIDAERYFDGSSPAGILYNRAVLTVSTANGAKKVQTPFLKENAFPLTAEAVRDKVIDGYSLYFADPETGDRRYYSQNAPDFVAVMRGERTPEAGEGNVLTLSREEGTVTVGITAAEAAKEAPSLLPSGFPMFIFPLSMEDAVLGEFLKESGDAGPLPTTYLISASDHAAAFKELKTLVTDKGLSTSRLADYAEENEANLRIITVINVFSYGFITLISLIAAANVFNTISTGVMLRRREFAVLKSIGLGRRGFMRMMNYECLIYGFKALLWGLPASVALTFLIWRISGAAYETRFTLPWQSLLIAVGSVFIVVFLSMFYAARKIRKDNPIDALKNENL